MLENIILIDQPLFYFINKNLADSFTKFIMPIVTDVKSWMPLFAVFCVYQIWKGGLNGRLCVAAILLGILICDQLNSSIIKEIFQRPRPCHFLLDINLLVGCGAGKSFPSSHAANSMMAVTVIALFFRKHKYWLPLLAVLVGVSRIFVGVHFPFDVFVGWLVGVGVGFFMYWLTNFLHTKYKLYKKIKRK
jgi:undecaprenyl-diphosphatase